MDIASFVKNVSKKETIKVIEHGSNGMYLDAVTVEILMLGLRMDFVATIRVTQDLVKT